MFASPHIISLADSVLLLPLMWLFFIFVTGNGILVCELVLSIFPQAQKESIYNNERHFLVTGLQDKPNKLLSMETKNGVNVNFYIYY